MIAAGCICASECDCQFLPDTSNAICARDYKGARPEADQGAPLIAHSLRADGFDASEDGTGRGTPIVPVATPAIAIQERAVSENPENGPGGKGFSEDGSAYTLEARNKVQAVAFNAYQRTVSDVPGPLTAGDDRKLERGVMTPYAVRRLTPRECERLQGFPDDYTDIPWRGKKHAPDGPRYKALGNSMAVNVMSWIGQRIAMVEEITEHARRTA